MNRWVKTMANENSYYRIFYATLCLFALIGTILFGVVGNYAPGAAKYVAILFILGAGLLAVAARITHNLCYTKVHGGDNDENAV